MGIVIRWQISTLTLKHPERDRKNGQNRNVLLVEHIYLIIGKSTMEGKFRIARDTYVKWLSKTGLFLSKEY